MHRRRRDRYRPLKDWRDPDMLVQRTWIEPWGEKVTKEITAKESTELSAEGLEGGTHYRFDPSYYWAREARRKRKGS